MKKKILSPDTESGQMVGEAIIEAVENQLRDNDPPEANLTLKRLMSSGESREAAIRYIASALSIEIYEALNNNSPYNEKRYITNLRNLPALPYE